MELDYFNEELRLAFEYSGELRSKDVDFFKNSSSQQRARDIIKDELCKNNGVGIIRASYKDKNCLKDAVMEKINGILR